MGKPSPSVMFFFSSCLFMFILDLAVSSNGQIIIPPKVDGFIYGGISCVAADSVLIEAYFDPLCPDSRDAWPPLKKALDYYNNNNNNNNNNKHSSSSHSNSKPTLVTFTFHLFPLPYHNNAFIASRAIHIANKLNSSFAYPLLEGFFAKQQEFYNSPTVNESRATITREIAEFAASIVGNSTLSVFESGFENTRTDLLTRISFKYGCARAVTGTPYFFVNGFPLADSGSSIEYSEWRSIIDPLLGSSSKTDTSDQ